jgi:hypothetical protein
MSTHDDDEALTWAGDRDRDTTNITWSAPKAGKSPSSSRKKRPSQVEPVESPRSVNGELIVTAGFGAVYLLITVAWLIVALRDPITIADPLGNAMFIVGLWAAVVAAPLWCGGVIVLAQRWSLGRRAVLFALGILVLIPWPYLGWAS